MRGRVILINLAVFLALCAVLEVALHIVSPRENPLLVPHDKAAIADPVFSHTLRANFDGYRDWDDRHYHMFTNALGFKDVAARAVPMKSDRHRIVFIGDSFTEGLGLPYEETFVGRFAQAFPDIDVLNAGVSSYAPSVYYQKLKYFIDKGLKFDEAIVFIDESDIQDEAVVYHYDGRGVLQTNLDTSCSAIALPTTATPSWKLRIAGFFYVPNYLYQTLKTRMGARPKPLTEADLLKPEGNWGRNYWRGNWSYAENPPCYGRLGVAGGLDKARAQMDRLHALLAAHGIALSVGVYPWPQHILYDKPESRQVTVWRDWCADKCAHFYDGFPVFFAYGRQHPDFLRRLFLWNDVHYTEEGNRLLGDEIVRQYRVARSER